MRLKSLREFEKKFASKKHKFVDYSLFKSFFETLKIDLSQKSIIHVVGTNGKGSVVKIAEALYKNNGYKVHSFTSPHLTHITERITLSGKPVDQETLLEALNFILNHKEASSFGYFHLLTLAAFYLFSKNPADIILVEAGLGGLYDPTNIIPCPLAVVITKIGYDHQEVLGNSLLEIAKNKAGVFKKACLVVTTSQQPKEVLEELKARAFENSCPVLVSVEPPRLTLPPYFRSYLKDNAVLCLELVHHLQAVLPTNEILNHQALETYSYSGRHQQLQSGILKNLFLNHEIFLDGAHNEDGFKELSSYLSQSRQKTLILASVSKTEKIQLLKKHLSDPLHTFLFVGTSRRALTKQSVYTTLQSAIKKTYKLRKNFSRIIVTGSLYLVGDVLKNYS